MLQEYFSNLLRNPETTQAWDQQIRDIGLRNQEDRATRALTTSEMGLFGPAHSATAAAAQRAMGQGDIDARLAAAQVAQNAQQYMAGQRAAGAQGLAGLGGELWGAPAGLEMQLLGLNSTRQMQNIINMLQAMNLRQNSVAQAGQLQGQQMVEPTIGPSDFDRYVAPLLNAGLQGLGAALPFLLLSPAAPAVTPLLAASSLIGSQMSLPPNYTETLLGL